MNGIVRLPTFFLASTAIGDDAVRTLSRRQSVPSMQATVLPQCSRTHPSPRGSLAAFYGICSSTRVEVAQYRTPPRAFALINFNRFAHLPRGRPANMISQRLSQEL